MSKGKGALGKFPEWGEEWLIFLAKRDIDFWDNSNALFL